MSERVETVDVGRVHVLREPGGPCADHCPHPEHPRPEPCPTTSETEYLRFREIGDTGKTKTWAVQSVRHGDVLGLISWYGRWRQYTFRPGADTVWNVGCLADVQTFITEQMTLWHAEQAAKRKAKT